MKNYISVPSIERIDTPLIEKESLRVYRNQNIDIVKVLAAIGVISIHVHNDTVAADNLGRFYLIFCVPFFYTTSLVYFNAGLNKNISTRTVLLKIWQRIGVPFLSWSCIYAGLLLIKHTMAGQDTEINFGVVFLYGASAEHMYYLPELIVMQAIIFSIFLLTNTNRKNTAFLLFISAVCYLAWGNWHNNFGVTTTGAVIAYTFMAIYLAPKLNAIQKNWVYFGFGLLLVGLPVSSLWVTYPVLITNSLLRIPIGGIGLLLITLTIPKIIIPNWLSVVASTTYGVYLSHVMFLEAIEFFLDKIHYDIHYDIVGKCVMALFVFALCVLFTLIVRKISLLRLLLLGEGK